MTRQPWTTCPNCGRHQVERAAHDPERCVWCAAPNPAGKGVPPPLFGGHQADGRRHPRPARTLGSQLERVLRVFLDADGEWLELGTILRRAGLEAGAGVTARIRDLRKKRHGGFAIQARPHPRNRGQWEYQLPDPGRQLRLAAQRVPALQEWRVGP